MAKINQRHRDKATYLLGEIERPVHSVFWHEIVAALAEAEERGGQEQQARIADLERLVELAEAWLAADDHYQKALDETNEAIKEERHLDDDYADRLNALMRAAQEKADAFRQARAAVKGE